MVITANSAYNIQECDDVTNAQKGQFSGWYQIVFFVCEISGRCPDA